MSIAADFYKIVSQQKNFDYDGALLALADSIGEEKALAFFADIAGYKKVPPSITEFITSDKYLGKFFRGGKGLYPVWLETLQKIYPHPLYSPYDQIILTGAIGQGKSMCAVTGMMYDICRMLHMKDPHEAFMMVPGKKLIFAIFNTTLKAADSVLMTMAKNMVESSEFFQYEKYRHLKRKPKVRKTIINATISIGPFIQITCSSRDNHIRGEDVVSGILSEINFQGAAKKDQAVNNYNELRSRIDSRFKLGEDFDLPGRCWCDSSRKDETGELEKIIKKSVNDPKTLMTEYPQWDVLGPAGKKEYKYLKFKTKNNTWEQAKQKALNAGAMFEIFIGDPKQDPFIIEGAKESKGLSDDYKMMVPIEHKREFEQDMYTKLKDLAGVATWSTYKFVYQDRYIYESCILDNSALLKQVIDLPFESDAPQGKLIDYVNVEKCLSKKFSYYVHMDYAAVNDHCGLAFTRNMGLADMDPMAPYTDQLSRLCFYQTDLVIYLRRQPGKEVPIAKIEDFIVALKRLGYQIVKFTADQYQSKHTLQVLPDKFQIPSEHYSVDRTRDAYDLWKRLMMNVVEVDGKPRKQWLGPKHHLLIVEFKNLVDLGKKIDHPDPTTNVSDDTDPDDPFKKLPNPTEYKPSKDGTDAVVGSLWQCYHDSTTRKVVTAAQQSHFKQKAKAQPVKTQKDSIKDIALAKIKANNTKV